MRQRLILFFTIVPCLAVPLLAQDSEEEIELANEYLLLSKQHQEARKFDQAIEAATTAIQVAPFHSRSYFHRCDLYAEKHEYRKAIEDLTKFLELEPDRYSALFNRGLYHEYLKEYDKAIADYTAAADDDADFSFNASTKQECQAHALSYRGRAYQWCKKDPAKALADFTKALQLDPKLEMVHYRRGQVHHDLKRYAAAAADYATALERDPDYPNLLASWAWQMATCPDPKFRDGQKALEYATRACEGFEMKVGSHLDVLAAAYAENGRFKEAVETEKLALERLDPRDAERKSAMTARLKLFEAGQPFREE